MKTAFVYRPLEFGEEKRFNNIEVNDKKNWDFTATDFLDLAQQLGC